MVSKLNCLEKYVTMIYALSSEHEKIGLWIKAAPKPPQSRNSRPGYAEGQLGRSKLK